MQNLTSNQQNADSAKQPIEPLLDPNNERLTIFPIKFKNIWDMYKKQQAAFWKAEEIDFSKDADDFLTLDADEQHFIKMILAFFAAGDGIVNFNLRERFLNEIKITEAQVVYAFQMMMENIHGEVYSKMLDEIVKDPVEKQFLFNSVKSVPAISLMAEWALKWIHSDAHVGHRIIAFAAVELIFFSGAFAAIFWLKKYRSQGKDLMNGLVKSNQLIARDEGMHCEFACLLYSYIKDKPNKEVVFKIIDEAVTISKQFNKDAIKCQLLGMNIELMSQYIEYVGDTLLSMLGYNKIYNTDNPFEWIESIGLANKTNFFESRPTEYQMAHSTENIAKKTITILEDF